MAQSHAALWALRDAYRTELLPARRQQLWDILERAIRWVVNRPASPHTANPADPNHALTALEHAVTVLQTARSTRGDVAAAIASVATAVDGLVGSVSAEEGAR